MRIIEKYNNISSAVQHAFLFVGIIGAAIMSYAVMSADIQTLNVAKVETAVAIQEIKIQISGIKIEQAVAAANAVNAERTQTNFRLRTDHGLESILNRLNSQ